MNQIEILELKNTMNEMKNAIESNSRLNQAKERTSDIEDRNFEIIQSEENTKNNF